jgi:uncharacterized RDD family membrane protein YckC
MKCPKCSYLGFETGDRCKNCGYDFSLLTAAAAVPVLDLPLREPAVMAPAPSVAVVEQTPPAQAVTADGAVAPEALPVSIPPPGRPKLVEPALPLFNRQTIDDDAPLIRLPAAPRAPLAVRRTPEAPRPRTVPRSSRRAADAAARADDPLLAFAEEPVSDSRETRPAASRDVREDGTSGPARRAIAAALDHAILLGIDAIVIYFTLRLAEFSIGDWRSMPLAPMVLFLLLIKGAYFCVFTLVGGQTIGKMAVRIRVVAEDGPMDPSRAIGRTLAGLVSVVTLGAAFLPALLSPERRALHDRLARTRVIALS